MCTLLNYRKGKEKPPVSLVAKEDSYAIVLVEKQIGSENVNQFLSLAREFASEQRDLLFTFSRESGIKDSCGLAAIILLQRDQGKKMGIVYGSDREILDKFYMIGFVHKNGLSKMPRKYGFFTSLDDAIGWVSPGP